MHSNHSRDHSRDDHFRGLPRLQKRVTTSTLPTRQTRHAERRTRRTCFCGRGVIPLPLLVGTLIALVLVAAAAFVLLTAPPAKPLFKLYVTSEGDPVEGASAIAYDGEAVAGSASTNAQGTAVFENLPAKTLVFKITKPGYRPLVQSLDATRPSAKVELESLVAAKKETQIIFKAIDKATGAPVEGVAVSLVIAGERKTIATAGDGFASVEAAFLSQVSAKFTKPGYKQQAITLLAKETRIERAVELEKEFRTPRLGFETLETVGNETRITLLYGTAFATVSDKQNIPLQGAQVKVFDAATQALVASLATDENGLAVFDTLPLGKEIFFTAFKEGFLPFDGSGLAKKTEETATIELKLEEATPLNSQVIKFIAVDADDNPVPAKIWVLTQPASVLAELEVDESGVEELEAAVGVAYYAYATSPGMLPAWSKEFAAGEAVKLVFEKASEENSANLTLAVQDEDSLPVYGAVASLFTVEGLFAGPSRVTDSEGLAAFEGLSLGEYEVRVGYAQKTSGGRIALGENKVVKITIDLAVAWLNAAAFDAVNGLPAAAGFASYRHDELFSACSTQAGASCKLKVKAGVPVQVKTSSPGYLDYVVSKTLEIDSTENLTAALIPSSAVVQPEIEFLNLTTLGGKPVAFVKPGGVYEAHFLTAAPEESDFHGFYLRLGDGENVSQEIAGIQEPPVEGALSIGKSTTFKPSQACVDLANDQPADGLLKWIDLSYSGTGSRVVKIKVKVSEKARPADKLELRFRTYSVKGPVWSRSPEDAELGNAENSSTKAGCYAQTYAKDYEVVVPRTSFSPEEVAKARSEFTPTLAVRWNAELQKLESNVKEILFQIDPIMPADAIPLKINSSEVLVAPVESNSTPSTTECYGIDSEQGVFWFKARETNPSCPIRVAGNEIQGDEAVLPIAYAAAPSHVLKIPIRVAAKSLESFFIKPENDALGEGDAAKIIYLVNNKQLGARTFVLESFAGMYGAAVKAEKAEVTVDGSGVKAVAWRGPGILDITEEGVPEVLREYFYNPTADYRVRGVSYGVLGQRTTSCSDYRCCAGFWCTKRAASQAIDFFKAEAARVGEATAFRRGGGMPWQYFSPERPFSFYTVVQVIQGGQAALEALGINCSVGATCGRENPFAFELKASSSNGSTWSYEAKPVELKRHAYAESAGRAAAPASLELCNYLYASGYGVNQSNTSNEFTWHQKSKFDLEINVCMFPIFGGWSPFCALGIPVHPRVSVLSYKYEKIENEGTTEDGINKVREKTTSSSLSVLGVGKEGWEAMKKCAGISLEWRHLLVQWATRSLDWVLAKKGERRPYKTILADWVNQVVPVAVADCTESKATNCRGLVAGVVVGGFKGLPGGYTIKVCDGIQIRIDVGLTYKECGMNLAPEVTDAARMIAAQVGSQMITWLAFNEMPTLSCITPVAAVLPIAGAESVEKATAGEETEKKRK